MKNRFFGGAAASSFTLALALSVSAAHADEGVASGPLADGHAPAGVMFEHMHKGGEVMVGLRLMRDEYGGATHRGGDVVSDADLAAAGYGMAVAGMTMDMAMLDIMVAPTDNLTLMLMPQYMRMKMVMRGLPMVDGGDMHGGGHAMMPGETHGHSIDGFGDTIAAAMYRLVGRPGLDAHVTLALSVPTGDVDRKNADGSYVHYGMQPGSGTWDVMPSATIRLGKGATRFGGQAGYLWRTENANDSGFAFGDRFWASAWASHRLAPAVSLSGRALFTSEGAIKGHYNGAHSHMSPADRQANYGGDRLELGLGVNLVARAGPLKGVRLGTEAMVPVYQRVNGYQPEKQWGLNVSLSKAF